MADLSWFPYDVDEWTKRVRELGLSYADEGALMRLYRGAWVDPDPCTIADTPDEFARLLGAHWEKVLPVLRVHFTPHPEKHGRLRSDWLLDVYQKALAKHESYSKRGKLGGRPSKTADDAESSASENESSALANGGKTESSAISSALAQLSAKKPATTRRRTGGGKPKAQLKKTESSAKAQLSQSTTEVLSCALTEHTAKNPATDGAPAPDGGAALAAANSGNGNGQPPPDATPPPMSTDADLRAEEDAARRGMRSDGAPVVRQGRLSPIRDAFAAAGLIPPSDPPESTAPPAATPPPVYRPPTPSPADVEQERAERRLQYQVEYAALCEARFDAWMAENRPRASVFEAAQRKRISLEPGVLMPEPAKTLRKVMIQAWRQLSTHSPPIPTVAEYINAREAELFKPDAQRVEKAEKREKVRS